MRLLTRSKKNCVHPTLMMAASSSNCQPKPPEYIFPDLVWDTIFKHLVASPKDLITCFNTSLYWQTLLRKKSKLQTFLMAEVLPLVGKFIVAPKDILNCRLVCTSWRWSVDNYLANHPNHNSITESIYQTDDEWHDSRYYTLGFKTNMHTVEKVVHFASQLEDGLTYNPVFTRYVLYEEDTCSHRAIFEKILSLYGSEIWHCRIRFFSTNVDLGTIYEQICRYLSLMPNLKSFWLENLEQYFENLEELNSLVFFLGNSLPNIENLECLTMTNITHSLQMLFLNRYNHIRMLRCSSLNFRDNYSRLDAGIQFNRSMTRLEELNGCYFAVYDLNRLYHVNWPLKLVKLEHLDALHMGHVFYVMSHFRDTLVYLSISFDFGEDERHHYRYTSYHKLYIPRLRSFSLTAPGLCLHSIDFLEPCVNLESLYLETCRAYRWADARILSRATTLVVIGSSSRLIIQFNGYIGFMYESNIWTVLPHLRKLSIEMKPGLFFSNYSENVSYRYTRTGYDTFKKHLSKILRKLN